jgi:pimeloyl-ACP methyl ester carboxylesterase
MSQTGRPLRSVWDNWSARCADRPACPGGVAVIDVSRRRSDIKTVVVPGASHLVHLDRPDGFTAAIRAAAAQSP